MTTNQVEITVETATSVEGCLILHLKGEMDLYNTDAFRRQVFRFMDEGVNKLIFDCDRVPYMSSYAVASFPLFMNRAKPQNGNIAMANVRNNPREVIQLLGFAMYVNVMGTLEEALEFIASTTGPAALFPAYFACPACARRLKAVRTGRFRCSHCKTVVIVDEAGKARLAYPAEGADIRLIPEKTEKVIGLLGELSRNARQWSLDQEQKAIVKKTLGQAIVNLYQREVKDVWAELQEVRS